MKRLDNILPKPFRHRGLGVLATLLLRAALNFAGLALLLPVLALLLVPEGIRTHPQLAALYDFFGFSDERIFAAAVCGAVVTAIIVKNGLNILLYKAERNYLLDLYRTLSRRLYTVYYNQGLAFVRKKNSATLTRNVNAVCFAFTNGVVRPTAAIIAETTLLILLSTALTLYAPFAMLLAAIVFLPATIIYYLLVRNRLTRCGHAEHKALRTKARTVAETFRGYADIEINGAFPEMLRTFDCTTDEVVRTRAKAAGAALLPQAFTEVGVVAGMALLVFAGRDNGNTQLLFGVFAIAALRMLPSVRNILSGWSSIKYNRYTVDILQEALAEAPQNPEQPNAPERLPFEQQIEIRNLCFRFPDDGHTLFSNLTFSIRKAERLGIAGPSGSGKTTLFNILLGLYTPAEGSIEIDGTLLTANNRRRWQQRIGYVSQQLFLTDGTLAQNVALGVSQNKIDRARVMEALHTAQLAEFIEKLPQGIDTPVGESGCLLSGGERQRIGIARALYREADVLFFDEATSALDNHTEEEVNQAIRELTRKRPGLTMLIIAHRETSLAPCDRVITLGE